MRAPPQRAGDRPPSLEESRLTLPTCDGREAIVRGPIAAGILRAKGKIERFRQENATEEVEKWEWYQKLLEKLRDTTGAIHEYARLPLGSALNSPHHLMIRWHPWASPAPEMSPFRKGRHHGVDLNTVVVDPRTGEAVDQKMPVPAIAAGRVHRASTSSNSGYGKHVVIEHDLEDPPLYTLSPFEVGWSPAPSRS